MKIEGTARITDEVKLYDYEGRIITTAIRDAKLEMALSLINELEKLGAINVEHLRDPSRRLDIVKYTLDIISMPDGVKIYTDSSEYVISGGSLVKEIISLFEGTS